MSNPILSNDIESFLNYIGAKSEQTYRTYRTAVQHLVNYLQEEWNLSGETSPASLLTPEMFHQYPAWLARQTWKPSQHAQPRLLSENTQSLYLTAAGNLLTYLTKLKRLAGFDPADIEAIRDTFRRASSAKQAPIHQKVPPDDIVSALIEAARQ